MLCRRGSHSVRLSEPEVNVFLLPYSCTSLFRSTAEFNDIDELLWNGQYHVVVTIQGPDRPNRVVCWSGACTRSAKPIGFARKPIAVHPRVRLPQIARVQPFNLMPMLGFGYTHR